MCLALRDLSILIIFYCIMENISWNGIFPFQEKLPDCLLKPWLLIGIDIVLQFVLK